MVEEEGWRELIRLEDDQKVLTLEYDSSTGSKGFRRVLCDKVSGMPEVAGPVPDWEQSIALMDACRWHTLSPVAVAADFKDRLVDLLRERMNDGTIGGGIDQLVRWQAILRQVDAERVAKEVLS